MPSNKPTPLLKHLLPLAAAVAVAAPWSAAQADVVLTPSTHDFGDVVVGEAATPLRFVLENELDTGQDPILFRISGTETGADVDASYTSVNTCRVGTNLMRGDNCTFDFNVTPRELGPTTLTLEFGFTPSSFTRTLTVTINGVAAPTPTTPPTTPSPGAVTPAAVPVLDAWGLGLLSAGVAGIAWWRRRRG
ncbi:IPTL-CTERM sorting domain-containing protein [Parahaliea mediterranea]|uniref:IPTL-CTERM sorting domain-containing protein n=1 Tax=Parahaliea mediterranea TaxID=651086 RepID=UPI000E2F4C48|nr:IPTL-CTERM sorting domain-containing protein [Parahaliea mediterranea]